MVNFTPEHFHPHERGIEKVLGELESKVMEVIWMKRHASVREVCQELSRIHKELSFNAIMTVMNRLEAKKLLVKKKIDGIYQYSATQSREAFLAAVTHTLLASVVNDPSLFSVARFSEVGEKLDKKTIEKLKKFIDSLS